MFGYSCGPIVVLALSDNPQIRAIFSLTEVTAWKAAFFAEKCFFLILRSFKRKQTVECKWPYATIRRVHSAFDQADTFVRSDGNILAVRQRGYIAIVKSGRTMIEQIAIPIAVRYKIVTENMISVHLKTFVFKNCTNRWKNCHCDSSNSYNWHCGRLLTSSTVRCIVKSSPIVSCSRPMFSLTDAIVTRTALHPLSISRSGGNSSHWIVNTTSYKQ